MIECARSLWIFSVLFLWGLFITPVSINISKRFRILDLPGGRKLHDCITPYGGGLVLWTGYMLWSLFFSPQGTLLGNYGTGVTMIFLIGYLDDITPVKPWVRMIFHVLAAGLVVWPLDGGLSAKLILLLWVTGMTNAFNLIDGINGLCLMVFLVSSLVFTFFSPQIAWYPLAGLTLGLLRWNFPKATIFLGDGGSTFLGYIFSSHLVLSFPGKILSHHPVILVIMLFFLGGVPALDTVFAIFRRSISHGSPFAPDRGHLHHRLIDLGFSTPVTVLLLTSIHGAILVTGLFLLVRY